jgi:hypothetical protein
VSFVSAALSVNLSECFVALFSARKIPFPGNRDSSSKRRGSNCRPALLPCCADRGAASMCPNLWGAHRTEGLLLAMCQPSPSSDGMTPNAPSRLPPSRARRVGECRHSQAHAGRNGIENTVGHVLSQVAGDHNDWPRITAPGADEIEDRRCLMDSSRVVTRDSVL